MTSMTTTMITRVPAGVPTGGQFSEHDRADSTVELGTEELCDGRFDDHLVVGDESPYCARCHQEFPEMSTLDGAGDHPMLTGFDADVDAAFADIQSAIDAEQQDLRDEVAAAEALGTMRERAIAYYDEASSAEPIGYTYRAENFRADKIVERLIADGLLAPAARDMSPHEAVEMAASANAIDFENSYTYDSDEFPKRIWAYQVDPSGSDDDLDWLAGE